MPPMQLVWIGFGVFFLASLGVGLRLLALAGRTRQAPELLIGLAVLGIGPVGFGLQAVAVTVEAPGLAEALATAGAVSVACGLWAKLLFNWLVYRRDSRIALAVCVALAVVVATHLLAQPMRGSFLNGAQSVSFGAVRGALQAAALGWGAVEAVIFWGRLRRRSRIGLAEPALVNRFLMWAISAAAAGIGTAVGVAGSLASGKPPIEIPWVLASSSAHGIVAAIGMWLAFAPPRAYARWVAGGVARA
jgi:hypothetical protein